MEQLLYGITNITGGQIIMMLIGAVLMYLGIEKKYEPTLLVPMGLGAILVNFPMSGLVTQTAQVGLLNQMGDIGLSILNPANAGVFTQVPTPEPGVLNILFDAGIATELFPLLLFIGIGAMVDFGPLLQNPLMLLFGGAAQFGIFFTIMIATIIGFPLNEAASIGSIATADGPTAIVVANLLAPNLLGSITVAAYSYMALVPIIQPFTIKLVTTKKERAIRMHYKATGISKRTKILFPIIIIAVAGLIAPKSLPLVGFLMFGNLLRECGVLNRLSETAQNEMVNLISILLGFTIAVKMTADQFLTVKTLLIILLGLIGFTMDTIGGVLFVKILNFFRKEKMNPMIGAAGISAFPMSARVVQKLATEADKQNFVLNYAIGANVSGQIASVIAGGLLLSFFGFN